MAIGFRRSRLHYITGLAASLLVAFSGLADAGDQILLKSGSTITGQITGVSDGQIQVTIPSASGAPVKSVVYLTDVKSVQMATPDAVTALKNATPETVISTLAPIVKQYAGLDTPWVVDAMAQLADAYSSAGQDAQAVAVYVQINQLYPGSNHQNEAAAGLAQLDLQQGKVPDALAKLQPVIDKASQDLAPSPSDARSYARAFLVYGQALQQEKENSKALEAYLTVKTMFYQNPALVAQAEKLASALRQQNPGIGVD
jgi:tetratricopeptide (TPR) repeat protein